MGVGHCLVWSPDPSNDRTKNAKAKALKLVPLKKKQNRRGRKGLVNTGLSLTWNLANVVGVVNNSFLGRNTRESIELWLHKYHDSGYAFSLMILLLTA